MLTPEQRTIVAGPVQVNELTLSNPYFWALLVVAIVGAYVLIRAWKGK